LKVPGNAEKLRVKSFESEQMRGKSKRIKHVSTKWLIKPLNIK